MEIVSISVVEATETVTINVTEGFGSVTNSDATYNATVNVSETLVLPDITHTDTDGTPTTLPAQTPMVCTPAVCSGADVTNSDNTYSAHINDGDTLVLSDVPNVDSTGDTVMTPAMTPFVATPAADDRNAYFYFIATYDDYQLITADANAATTWTTETLTNVDTIAYEKNSVSASLPITLAVGDTLKITITRTNAALDSLVKLNN